MQSNTRGEERSGANLQTYFWRTTQATADRRRLTPVLARKPMADADADADASPSLAGKQAVFAPKRKRRRQIREWRCYSWAKAHVAEEHGSQSA